MGARPRGTGKKKPRAAAGRKEPARRPPKIPLAALIALVFLATAGAAALIAVLASPKPFVIALCDIDEGRAPGIKAEIDAWAASSRIKVEYRGLGSAALDAKILRGVDAVLLYPSIANKKAAGLFESVPRDKAGLAALPMRKSTEAGGRDWAMPLLIDTWEISWRSDLFSSGAISGRAGSGDLAARLKSIPQKAFLPFVAAGGDDASLVDIAGILVAERGGAAAYARLVELVGRADAAGPAVLETDLGGVSLAAALAPLVRLGELGLSHPNWLEFKKADLVAVSESHLASLAMQRLSTRRAVKRDALASWKSAPIARAGDGELPVVTASILSLAEPKASRKAEDFESLRLRLTSPEGQRALQQGTGLAPAIAAAQAVDVQAAEARAAASGAVVLQGLSRDAFPSDKERAEFAAVLRAFLEGSRS